MARAPMRREGEPGLRPRPACKNSSMRFRGSLAAVLCLALAAVGCKSSSDFDAGTATAALQSHPMKLEGEQVTLTQKQIDCAVQADLWDPPTELPPDHAIAHLKDKGRDLKFNDDVVIRDPNSKLPYVQVRGDLPLHVQEITAIRDGDQPGTKLVEAKVGVKIDHPCFSAPLPLMGVRHGNFTADAPVVFHFSQGDGGAWQADQIVH